MFVGHASDFREPFFYIHLLETPTVCVLVGTGSSAAVNGAGKVFVN